MYTKTNHIWIKLNTPKTTNAENLDVTETRQLDLSWVRDKRMLSSETKQNDTTAKAARKSSHQVAVRTK